MDLIFKAKQFAVKKHDGQTYNGEEFVYHPFQVADILRQTHADENLVVAGILHDTIEDTDTTYEELVEEFNQDVADLVMEVTDEGQKDSYGKYFPRLKTQRGIRLKFADRLSNLTNMDEWDEKRKAHYLRKSKFWKDGSEL